MYDGIEAFFWISGGSINWEQYELLEKDLELQKWPWIKIALLSGGVVLCWLQCFIVKFHNCQEGFTNVLFKPPSDFGS
jgi:hypothetical protein